MNKGIRSDLIIEDDLEYLTKLYGKTKFSEIWESCKPKLNSSNIDFGKIICFGTCGEIK